MALVKFSPLVSGASGKVGGVVFSRTVGGSAVRSWAKGTDPKTQSQLAQRSLLSQLSATYAQLTPAQRQSFVDAANLAEHKVTNRLGEARNLTGPQFYTKVNLLLQAAGLPLISEYSGYWEAPMFSVKNANWNVSPTGKISFDVVYADGWVPFSSGETLCVKISRPTPPGRKPTKTRNLIAVNESSPEVLVVDQIVQVVVENASWKAVFGDVTEDYRFQGQVLALSPTHPWDSSVEKIEEGVTVN